MSAERMSQVQARHLLTEAVEAVKRPLGSLSAMAAVRISAVQVMASLSGFREVVWLDLARRLHAFAEEGRYRGLISGNGTSQGLDSLSRTIKRFVLGDNKFETRTVPEVLALYVIWLVETDTDLAANPQMRGCLDVNSTFAEVEGAVDRVLEGNPPASVPDASRPDPLLPGMRPLPREAIAGIKSMNDLLRPFTPLHGPSRALFRQSEDFSAEESYYAAFRLSSTRPDLVLCSFLAVRQETADGEPYCTFTQISRNLPRRTGRIARGIVISMQHSIYLIAGTTQTTSGDPVMPSRMHSRGLEVFAIESSEFDDSWIMPAGHCMSNNAGWHPVSTRFCLLHLGFRKEMGGRVNDDRMGPDLRRLDGPDGDRESFREHLSNLTVSFPALAEQRTGLDLDGLEAGIRHRMGLSRTGPVAVRAS